MRTCSSHQAAGLLLLTWVAGCGSGELTLPGGLAPQQLEAVAGDGQRGIVGDELPEPLVVRLSDAAGEPVSQVALSFQGDVPDILVEPAIIATDDTGYASVRVKLGATEGTQRVESRVADGSPDLRATFELVAKEQPHDRGRRHHDD